MILFFLKSPGGSLIGRLEKSESKQNRWNVQTLTKSCGLYSPMQDVTDASSWRYLLSLLCNVVRTLETPSLSSPFTLSTNIIYELQ